MQPVKKEGIREVIRRMAARAQGVGIAEIEGEPASRVAANMQKMRDLILVGHKQLRRAFLHPIHAKRYEDKLPEIRNAARGAARQKWQNSLPKARPKRGTDIAVVTIKEPAVASRDRDVIIPPHVKVQVCPSPEHFGPAAKIAYGLQSRDPKPLRVGREV
jgi:hypothetical protein